MVHPETIGRYRVERRLGHGSFATVWLAYDPDLDSRVAIKVLGEDLLHDEASREAFVREARLLRLLDDSRIVQVHLVDHLDDGRPFFAMEYADGGTLRERLDAGGRKASFSVVESIQLSREIAQGLAAAHDLGVIHRDLKPSNVLFKNLPDQGEVGHRTDGEMASKRLLLADFGIAAEDANLDRLPAGTPGYMAPEQFTGQVTPQSDIYAAGLILAELLVGGGLRIRIDPGGDEAAVQVVEMVGGKREVAPQLLQVLSKALKASPELRFESALAWDGALARAEESIREREIRIVPSHEPAGIREEQELPESTDNLPRQSTVFVGRRRELKKIEDLLLDRSLVTLTGAGGVGKSRLAYQAAASLRASFLRGVWVMEFASLKDPESVPQAIAQILGVRREPDRSIAATLVDHLRTAEILLVFDNCEHVLDAVARVAEDLVAQCPLVRIVATSREALGVRGETVWPLAGLETPREVKVMDAAELLSFEAITLFLERAREAKFSFALTSDNASKVGRICHTLDGVPLALELAAAKLRYMTIDEIVGGLDDRFDFLTSESPVALPHHRTLQSAIDWSYDLLDPEEQELLRCLAVFVGGFNVASVHGVCSGGRSKVVMLELVGRLIDQSMIQVISSDHVTRYTLLESIRQYAWNKLEIQGDLVEGIKGHRQFFLTFARGISENAGAPIEPEDFARLAAEQENLHEAISRSVRDGHASIAADLLISIGRLLVMSSQAQFGMTQIRSILRLAEELTSFQHTHLALTGALLAGDQLGREAESFELTERALQFSREIEGPEGRMLEAGAANNMGMSHAYFEGDYESARQRSQESLQQLRSLGQLDHTVYPMSSLGEFAYLTGDLTTATDWFKQCLEVSQKHSDEVMTVYSLIWLARTRLAANDLEGASEYALAASAATHELNVHGWDSVIAATQAKLAVRLSRNEMAYRRYRESFGLFRESGATQWVAETLLDLAVFEHQQGDPREAACLLGAAYGWIDRNQQRLHPIDQPIWDKQVDELRRSLGKPIFDKARVAGAGMTNAETFAYVLAENKVQLET